MEMALGEERALIAHALCHPSYGMPYVERGTLHEVLKEDQTATLMGDISSINLTEPISQISTDQTTENTPETTHTKSIVPMIATASANKCPLAT